MHSSINIFNPQYETVSTVIQLTRGNTTYWRSVGHNGVECSEVKYSSEQRYKPVMSLVKRWGQRWPHQGDPIKVTLEIVLCCVALCCVVLCCVALCCVVLCCIVLCCAVLCYVILCYVILCCIVLFCVVFCCIVLCCVLCCAVLCCIVLCCVVLCCVVLCRS